METKTALITGASSGIGLELAKLFARDGFDLVLVARRQDALESLAGELKRESGTNALVLAKDLSDPLAPEEIFSELKRRFIHVDVLVNGAGFQIYGPISETDLRKNLDLIQTNLVAVTHLTKLFLPGMIMKGRGRILNIGSTGSFQPVPLNAIYCATKAYVLSFSEGIASDLEGTGVTVTCLCPGPTRTRFAERSGIEDIFVFRYMTMDAKTVARIGYKALMAGQRVVVPGFLNKLLAFLVRLSPRRAVTIFGKLLMSKVK
jgi:short-subunit dehydrogenase